MANFRPGYLEQGSPLGNLRTNVMLSADNTVINTSGVSYLAISSDNTTAANRTFTLTDSTLEGQVLYLVFEAGSSYTCQLADSGNVKLSAAWEPLQYDSLTLMWDKVAAAWVEIARSQATGIPDIPLASAEILVGNSSGLAQARAVSGDIAITNAGVTSIAAGAIVNADVNAAAAIDYSKLATLTSGNILVGSAGNVATSVAMSGDVAIVASGATTIQAGAVGLSKLASAVAPSHVVKYAGQHTTVGGAAAEAIAVTGLAATDLVFVQMKNDGTSNVTIVDAVPTLNTLTVTFSADPGNDTVVYYQALRATS